MRLILLRHPKPLVAAGVCYGSTDLAVAADELERVRAELDGLPRHAAVYSSPLRRCAELATRLSAATQPHFDARLVEMDFGAWEMRRWDDIARAEIDAWAADLVHYRPGGGDSVLHMARRVADFYADIQRQQSGDSIVVCHAGTIRLLAACHAGLSPADAALQAARTPHAIAYGGALTLEF
jgi:alpha-ribazole phosphatase